MFWYIPERLWFDINVYTHLGLDDAKEEMEQLEKTRKEIEKVQGKKKPKPYMFKVI